MAVYQARERAFRNTSESTNSRVVWWSLFQVPMNLSEAAVAAVLEPGLDCKTGSLPRRNWPLADLVPPQLLPQEEARLIEIQYSTKHARADCLSSNAWKAFGQIRFSILYRAWKRRHITDSTRSTESSCSKTLNEIFFSDEPL